MRTYARALERQKIEARDVELPEFPDEAIHYLRMNVRDLRPAEYWQTSRYDYEMTEAVHRAWDEGVQDARETYGAKEG